MYCFFPQQVRRFLSEEALRLLEALGENDCEMPGGAEGSQELLAMGMAMLLEDGDIDAGGTLVVPRRFLRTMLG